MDKGLRMIAIGLTLTYKGRKRKIEELNYEIDSIADCIRSSSDVDGLPHGNSVGDPVGARQARIEEIEQVRDVEQERVNAVEWAMKYVRDISREEDGDNLIRAILMFFSGRKDEARNLIAAKTQLNNSSFDYARGTFLQQIILYLHLSQS